MNNNTTKNNSELALDFSDSVWESEEIGNTSTAYLRMTWFAIFEGFAKCIDFNSNNKPAKKIVIPAPTGTGKTLSMCYFMQNLEEHTGALIVVPFIDDANEIVERINKNADYAKALAFHSESEYWNKVDEIKNYQILVITHNLFIGASDRKHNQIGIDRGKMDKLYQYEDGTRSLTVIDESIETIRETSLKYNDIHSLVSVLDGYVSHKDSNKSLHDKIQKEIDSMNRLESFFDTADSCLNGKSETRIDRYMLHNHMDGHDLLFKNARYLSDSGKLRRFNQKLLNANIKKSVSEILDDIKLMMDADWMYYTLKDSALRTARDATPIDTTTVILDATSTIDHYYQIHTDVDFEISKLIPRSKVRNYQNVDLFLSKGQRTGGSQLTDSSNIAEYAEKIWEEVYDPFDDTETAIFTFKNMEPELHKYIKREGCENIHLGHFGNLTGKNDYQDCTKIFIVGTPFKPEYVTTNVHALSSRGNIECFNQSDEVRKERTKIKNTEIAAELVQVINRAACRRVVDKEGNCPKVEVYLLMPNDQELSGIIVNAIKDNMNNVNVYNWDFALSTAKKPGPDGLSDDVFIREVSGLESSISYSSITTKLGMTRGPTQNIRRRLVRSDEDDPIVSALHKYGFIFEKEGKGYWLIKH